MTLPLEMIPAEIIQQYKLEYLSHKRFVYFGNPKVMYGLPQAGKIANDKLKLHLAKFGYEPAPITPGLCQNQTRAL